MIQPSWKKDPGQVGVKSPTVLLLVYTKKLQNFKICFLICFEF